MAMQQKIDPDELEEGQVLQYEEKYHVAAVAKILSVEYEELSGDGEIKKPYQTVEIEILEPIFGPFDEGEEVTLGRTTAQGLQHYIDWKFKEPGTMTDYCLADSLEEHADRMNEIKEKYGS